MTERVTFPSSAGEAAGRREVPAVTIPGDAAVVPFDERTSDPELYNAEAAATSWARAVAFIRKQTTA
jgi:hypothetical protein